MVIFFCDDSDRPIHCRVESAHCSEFLSYGVFLRRLGYAQQLPHKSENCLEFLSHGDFFCDDSDMPINCMIDGVYSVFIDSSCPSRARWQTHDIGK